MKAALRKLQCVIRSERVCIESYPVMLAFEDMLSLPRGVQCSLHKILPRRSSILHSLALSHGWIVI